jgi:hypothetical protein
MKVLNLGEAICGRKHFPGPRPKARLRSAQNVQPESENAEPYNLRVRAEESGCFEFPLAEKRWPFLTVLDIEFADLVLQHSRIQKRGGECEYVSCNSGNICSRCRAQSLECRLD